MIRSCLGSRLRGWTDQRDREPFGSDQFPAFMSLALDVGFRCLPLIVERVELLLQAMLSRDAGVDGAAQRRFASLRSHGAAACRLGCRAKAAPRSLIGVEAASDEAASQRFPALRSQYPPKKAPSALSPRRLQAQKSLKKNSYVAYRFNRRYDLETMIPRLAFVALRTARCLTAC
jgi:hypothetical protein